MANAIGNAFRHLFGAGSVTPQEWAVLGLLALALVCTIAIVVAGILYCRAVLSAEPVVPSRRWPEDY
jgi:hypothetical protein